MEQRAYYSVREVTELICSDHVLILTALDDVLALLPTGNWIGAIADSRPMEYNKAGEPLSIQVNDLSEWVRSVHINSYQSFNFESIERDAYANGFSIVALPAFSSVHLSYGVYTATVPMRAVTPVIGWVAGADCGKETMRESVVVDGSTGEFYPERLVAMHCALHDDLRAWFDVLNPFVPDFEKPHFKFPSASFNISQCTAILSEEMTKVNKMSVLPGEKNLALHVNFRDYMHDAFPEVNFHYTPLVTTLRGEIVTNAFLDTSPGKNLVLAAPVIPGLSYYIGKRRTDEESLYLTNAGSSVLQINCQYTLFSTPHAIKSYGEAARYLYNLSMIRLHISRALQTIFL